MSLKLSHAAVVERVVAVVGEKPILLSELRARARPFFFRVARMNLNSSEQAGAETQVMRETLLRMVDEKLVDSVADKSKVSVTRDDVQNAIKNIASRSKLTVPELLEEARKSGLDEREYQEEIRRQLLEGKLVQIRLRGRVRINEEDAKNSYARFVSDFAQQQPVDLRVLALRIDSQSSLARRTERGQLANEIVARARSGDDFCKLVADYSDDLESKMSCGSRGSQPLSQFVVEIQNAAKSLSPGEVAGPISYGDALMIIQLASRPTVPPYADVKEMMMERATGEALEKQRKLWLTDIKKSTYVDFRL